MHRVDSLNYVTTGGKRRFKESPAPGTTLGKDFKNAVQEEVCQVVEAAQLTLAVSGAADESANWGQMLAAVRILSVYNVMGYGADLTGATSSVAAFNAALAANGTIYVPPGTYKIDSALTIPSGAMIVGSGFNTILAYSGSGNRISITNQDFSITDIVLDGAASTSAYGVNINFSADKNVLLNNIKITGIAGGLRILATTANQGYVYGNNVIIEDSGTNGNLDIGNTGGTTYGAKEIRITNLKSIQSTAGNFNVSLKGDETNGGQIVNLLNAYIYGGKLTMEEDTAQMWIKDSLIDLDLYTFNESTGGGFNNCIKGSDNTGTITNNAGGSDSRTFWKSITLPNGELDAPSAVQGILQRRYRGSSDQTVLTTASDNIIFNNGAKLEMANNTSYTKDDPWDNVGYSFIGENFGNGTFFINGLATIEGDTSTLEKISQIKVVLDVNGDLFPIAPYIETVHASTGRLQFAINANIITGIVPPGQIQIEVTNNQSGSVLIVNGAAETFIEVEGL